MIFSWFGLFCHNYFLCILYELVFADISKKFIVNNQKINYYVCIKFSCNLRELFVFFNATVFLKCSSFLS